KIVGSECLSEREPIVGRVFGVQVAERTSDRSVRHVSVENEKRIVVTTTDRVAFRCSCRPRVAIRAVERQQRAGRNGVEPVLIVELRWRAQCAKQQPADVRPFLNKLSTGVYI